MTLKYINSYVVYLYTSGTTIGDSAAAPVVLAEGKAE
jgi:hypothetical protein